MFKKKLPNKHDRSYLPWLFISQNKFRPSLYNILKISLNVLLCLRVNVLLKYLVHFFPSEQDLSLANETRALVSMSNFFTMIF